jgi:hypothetical protein
MKGEIEYITSKVAHLFPRNDDRDNTLAQTGLIASFSVRHIDIESPSPQPCLPTPSSDHFGAALQTLGEAVTRLLEAVFPS